MLQNGKTLHDYHTVPIFPAANRDIALRPLLHLPCGVPACVSTPLPSPVSTAANRDLLRSALAPLEPHVVGGEGAIYLWARLPPQPGCQDDRAVVEWLVAQAGVCVIPGSACGMPGEWLHHFKLLLRVTREEHRGWLVEGMAGGQAGMCAHPVSACSMPSVYVPSSQQRRSTLFRVQAWTEMGGAWTGRAGAVWVGVWHAGWVPGAEWAPQRPGVLPCFAVQWRNGTGVGNILTGGRQKAFIIRRRCSACVVPPPLLARQQALRDAARLGLWRGNEMGYKHSPLVAST